MLLLPLQVAVKILKAGPGNTTVYMTGTPARFHNPACNTLCRAHAHVWPLHVRLSNGAVQALASCTRSMRFWSRSTMMALGSLVCVLACQ